VISHTFPGVPFPLFAEGSPACAADIEGDAVTLTGGPKSDLFLDPAGDGTGPDAGRFLGDPPAGDFTLRARVGVDFRTTFDAAVLLVQASASVFAKLCLEYSPQGRPTVVTVVTRGTSDDANSFEVGATSAWLRITRSGRAWAFHASTDGSYWRLIRYFALGEREAGLTARVGFLAQSPTGESCRAVFEDIAFSARAPADLRDGS
jgi:regulation of enolase protein 1 (concanavalin A-like superfamily)